MPYAVESDLNLSAQRIIELTDSDAAPGVSDPIVLAQTEQEAENIVDAALAGTYDVPFSTPPRIVSTITAWIWRYRLYLHREVMDVPKAVMEDYAQAMEWLKGLAAGELPIGDDTTTQPIGVVLRSSCPRGFTSRSRTED